MVIRREYRGIGGGGGDDVTMMSICGSLGDARIMAFLVNAI